MGRSARWVVAILAGAWWSAGVASAWAQTQAKAPAPGRRGPATDAAAVEAKRRQLTAILEERERRSAGLRSLRADFTRVDRSPAWGETVEYTGTAKFQSPNLARIEFFKVDREVNPPRSIAHETIVCMGAAVLQYAFPTKQIFVYPIPREARKRAVEESSLALLFNVRARDLEARYQLTLLGQERDAYVIKVIPRREQDREDFRQAYLWLNTTTYLPDRLVFWPDPSQDTKDYTFRAIVTNPALDPSLFKPEGRPGWKIVENPAPAPPLRQGARPKGAAVR